MPGVRVLAMGSSDEAGSIFESGNANRQAADRQIPNPEVIVRTETVAYRSSTRKSIGLGKKSSGMRYHLSVGASKMFI
jgi:hypothetical protein